MEGSNKPKSRELALAFAVCILTVAIPAFFFVRMETSREIAISEQWRALAIARMIKESQDPLPRLLGPTGKIPREAQPGRGVIAVHIASAGGIDEYGIKRSASASTSGPDGRPIQTELESRFRELAGRLEQSPCLTTEGKATVCGVPDGAEGMVAVAFVPEGLDPTAMLLLIITVVLAFAAIVFLLSQKPNVGWTVWGCVGFCAGLLIALGLAKFSASVLEELGDIESLLNITDVPIHETAIGLAFYLVVALASAGIAASLGPPISRLFAEMRTRPFVYVSIAPAMVGMVLLIFVPFFMGVYLAFLDNQGRFVGLANFVEILFPSTTSDTNFYFTLGVTVMWTVLNVSLHVAIGLALALVLSDARLRGKSIYRVLLIVPWAVPNYITALVWKWIFNTQYGPANAFISLFGLSPVDWLGRSFWTNFTANLVTNTWLGFPFMMVVSLGALQSIPADLYEAAQIDGAGRWQRFRHITIPLLKPALFPAIILGTIWTFNMFNVVYLVSGGAPDNKTNILITEAYRAFRVLRNYGFAAAYSLIIFFILAAYTLVTNRITKAAESVYE